MDKKIKEAIELLRDSGYFVVEKTKSMEKAIEECSDDKCFGCSCNICVMQETM